MCRAENVGPLSDQMATLTVSTEPLITTEVAWDYARDTILANPESFGRHIYKGSGTTSVCFGYFCPIDVNPLADSTPTSTAIPLYSYTPPTSHPTTTASSTGEAGQDSQANSAQGSQGDATQGSGVSNTMGQIDSSERAAELPLFW